MLPSTQYGSAPLRLTRTTPNWQLQRVASVTPEFGEFAASFHVLGGAVLGLHRLFRFSGFGRQRLILHLGGLAR